MSITKLIPPNYDTLLQAERAGIIDAKQGKEPRPAFKAGTVEFTAYSRAYAWVVLNGKKD